METCLFNVRICDDGPTVTGRSLVTIHECLLSLRLDVTTELKFGSNTRGAGCRLSVSDFAISCVAATRWHPLPQDRSSIPTGDARRIDCFNSRAVQGALAVVSSSVSIQHTAASSETPQCEVPNTTHGAGAAEGTSNVPV